MGRGMCRSRLLLGMMTSAMLGIAGCSFFDDFSIKRMNFEDFRDPPEPLKVIRESKDGNLRARALRCIQEPTLTGGSKDDQDLVVSVLNYSAAHDTQPLCRMAAIDTLRKFRDPRAVDGLKDAYYKAGSFNPDVATLLRCQALQALGETKQPAAVETLVRVLREPPARGADQDRQQKLDERIAAARALGNFNQYQGTAALVEVLRKEQDVALRVRAHESLVQATGRNLPADATVWSDFLQNPGKPPTVTVSGPGVGQRILELTGLR